VLGLVASSVTIFLLSGAETGRLGENASALVVNLVAGSALAWFGQRRRRGYQFDRSLRG
jgi:hypothetical protein